MYYKFKKESNFEKKKKLLIYSNQIIKSLYNIYIYYKTNLFNKIKFE